MYMYRQKASTRQKRQNAKKKDLFDGRRALGHLDYGISACGLCVGKVRLQILCMMIPALFQRYDILLVT